MTFKIRRVDLERDQNEWLRLRFALWPGPEDRLEELAQELIAIAANPQEPVFVAERPDGSLGGMLEVSIRTEAEGCQTGRIGYLEGWYVDPELRGQGIGRQLVEAAEAWAWAQGCTEMASDTTPDYPSSPQVHARLGYREVQRTIHFRKELAAIGDEPHGL
ncbi:MAG: GNAT family N-acetyltransferase [Anaerolineales bacterium]|nr:GNAT family N-acetyltransferase [Anaerolineales bacterium]